MYLPHTQQLRSVRLNQGSIEWSAANAVHTIEKFEKPVRRAGNLLPCSYQPVCQPTSQPAIRDFSFWRRGRGSEFQLWKHSNDMLSPAGAQFTKKKKIPKDMCWSIWNDTSQTLLQYILGNTSPALAENLQLYALSPILSTNSNFKKEDQAPFDPSPGMHH